MVVPCNAGFVELVQMGIGGASDAWTHIALGTGTEQGAGDTTLKAESAVSGLARAAATVTAVTTTVTGDTIQLVKTFTAGGSAVITEAGAFNAASVGDMLMVGDFGTVASMVDGDTLAVTLKCQIKSA